MTPDALQRLLDERPGTWPDVSDPPRLLRVVEQAAEEMPTDRGLARIVAATHGLCSAADGLPTDVAGVRRGPPVRWDHYTATFDGTELSTGQSVRLRVLRPHAARDPVFRRMLEREGRAVQKALGSLPIRTIRGERPALLVTLPGAPLFAAADAEDRSRSEVLVRMLVTAASELARWEAHDLGPPRLDAREWVDSPSGLQIVCLTPGEPGPGGAALARIAEVLLDWWGEGPETAIDAALHGLCTFPPHTVAEGAETIHRALRDALATRWHALATRHRHLERSSRATRLLDLQRRLTAAVPPPEGVGAVGVDLDGQTTVVASKRGRILWGPVGGEQTEILTSGGEIAVREARRLLRMRAAAPPNPRLHAEVGGDIAFTEALCLWLSVALQLRTLNRLSAVVA